MAARMASSWTAAARAAEAAAAVARITPRDLQRYQRDGVVCLRAVFSDRWIDVMREATDEAMVRSAAHCIACCPTSPTVRSLPVSLPGEPRSTRGAVR